MSRKCGSKNVERKCVGNRIIYKLKDRERKENGSLIGGSLV